MSICKPTNQKSTTTTTTTTSKNVQSKDKKTSKVVNEKISSNIVTATEVSSQINFPQVKMFVHIPKTGGSSIREAMPSDYVNKFKWGNYFNKPGCGVKQASTFHLTIDEMTRCGMTPIPGPTLCVVRDPLQRFESEVRWRSGIKHFLGFQPKDFPKVMINKCVAARKTIDDDLYAHCQPQVRYLYHDSLSKQLKGKPVCDYLLSNPSMHDEFLSKILPKKVPVKNKSNKHDQVWSLSEDQVAWVKKFYHEDFEDPNIKLALQGHVLRKSGMGYEVIPGVA